MSDYLSDIFLSACIYVAIIFKDFHFWVDNELVNKEKGKKDAFLNTEINA